MKPAVSVIVPVYNVGQCLTDTMECLVSQTLENMEVILVDDGSTDGSGAVCDSYAQRYPFVHVIHKENGGVSIARNTGIGASTGDYIAFVDADDLVSRRYLEIMYTTAVRSNADMAICSWRECVPDQDELTFDDGPQGGETLLSREGAMYLITDLSRHIGGSVCNKLFRRYVVQDCRFTPNVPLGEDIEFTFRVMSRCGRIAFCDRVLYLYMMREGSAMHKPYRSEKEELLRQTYERILANPIWNSNDRVRSRMISYRVCVCELTILNKMLRDRSVDEKMVRTVQTYLRSNLKLLMKAPFPTKKKVQIALAAFSFPLYKAAMKQKLS